MLMRVAHDCRTTFVGGENIFVKALPWLQDYAPSSVRVAGKHVITRAAIMALLTDGRKWTTPEVAAALGGNPHSMCTKLAEMAKAGLIRRGMRMPLRPMKHVRSVPEYSLWSSPE